MQAVKSERWSLLFFPLAIGFVISLIWSPYPGDFLLKVSPILCLIAAVLVCRTEHYRLIAAALFFGGIGDVSLELGYFSFGLGAFLVGHLFYMAVFYHNPRFELSRIISVVALLALGVALLAYLAPHLGELKGAVYLYMGVILAMAVTAIMGGANHRWVAVGAVLFVVSDAIIAVNRFVEPIEGSRYGIMVLYYAAQYLLSSDARQNDARSAS